MAVSSRVRWTWKVVGTLFTVGMLGMGVLQTVLHISHKEYTEVEVFDAAGIAVVEVSGQAGPVRIIGTDAVGDTITVTARIEDGLQPSRHARRVEGDRLVLDGSCPVLSNFCRVAYMVELPSEVDVVVRAGERVTVSDVAGSVDVVSRGRIEVQRLSGPVRLDARYDRVIAADLSSTAAEVTANGRVELSFEEPPQSVEARSHYGRVEVVLPGDDAYRVDAASSYGAVVTGTMRIDPDSPRQVAARANGDVVIRYDG